MTTLCSRDSIDHESHETRWSTSIPKNLGVVDMIRVWDWYVTSITYSHCSHCSLCDPPFRPLSENLSLLSTRWLKGIVRKNALYLLKPRFPVSSFLEIHQADAIFPFLELSEAPLGSGSASVSHPDPLKSVDWCETYPAVLMNRCNYIVIHIICVYISIIYIQYIYRY